MQQKTETQNLSNTLDPLESIEPQTIRDQEIAHLDNLLVTGLANLTAFGILTNQHKKVESLTRSLLQIFQSEFVVPQNEKNG